MAIEKDIFISYSKNDLELVSNIVDKISAYGVSCWFQKQDSKQEFAVEISHGIKHSGSFVVFLSHSSISSMYVKSEIAIAFKHYNRTKGYKILPIFIEDIDECDELNALDIYLGIFNELFMNEFSSDDELILKMFEQLGIDPNTKGNSIYTADNKEESERLAIQNSFYNRYADTYIAEACSQMANNGITEPVSLDVGCADGTNTMNRVGPYTRFILGVDKDENLIKQANNTFASDTIRFCCTDITTKEFGSVMQNYLRSVNRDKFDFIHISAVLLHLPDPLFTLKILHDYLSPQGKIFIVDEDDGLNTVYPSDNFFEDCFFIWSKSLESGDRAMGRKLPSLLSEAGFSNVDIKRSTISSTDFGGEMREILWDLYFNPTMWAVNSPVFFSDKRAFYKIAPYTEAHAQHFADYMDGKIFIMLGVLFISADA